MFQDIWQFLCALVKHWATLATGGVIMAADWFYHSSTGTQMGKWEFESLVFLFLVMAAFLAWRDQRKIAQETLAQMDILRDAHSENAKALEEQVQTLQARLQNESFKTKEEREHDRNIFARLISHCDEIKFRDVCSGIGYYHFYDGQHYKGVRHWEHYGIQDENQFVNQNLREAFQKLHKSLDTFTGIVAQNFFNTSEDRYMLYPELKNSGDKAERQIYADAAAETKSACEATLAAFSEFRQEVKRLLYV